MRIVDYYVVAVIGMLLLYVVCQYQQQWKDKYTVLLQYLAVPPPESSSVHMSPVGEH